MARKDTLIVRNTNFTATRREWIMPQPLDGSVKAVGITIDVSGWNEPLARLTVGLEASYDGGTTWQHFCSVTAAGVPGTNPDGTPATATSIVMNLPPAGARMKAFAFTNGQSVRLAVSLVEIT